MKYSTTGYKDNSPDKNNTRNIMPGNLITMKGVSKQLTLIPIVGGKPMYDRQRIAKPGDSDIQFESDVESVLELPYAKVGTQLQNPYVQNFLNQQRNPLSILFYFYNVFLQHNYLIDVLILLYIHFY